MFFLPFSLLHAEPWTEAGRSFNVRTNSFVDSDDITEDDSLLRQTGALSNFGLDTFVSPDFIQRNPKFLELKKETLEAIDQKYLATLDPEEHDIYVLEQIGKTVKQLLPYKHDKNKPPYNTWSFSDRYNRNATDCVEHSFIVGLLAENIGIMHNPYSELVFFGYRPEGSDKIKYHVASSFNIGRKSKMVETTFQQHNPPFVLDFPDYIHHFETGMKKKAKILNTFQTDAILSTSVWHPWEEKNFVAREGVGDSND